MDRMATGKYAAGIEDSEKNMEDKLKNVSSPLERKEDDSGKKAEDRLSSMSSPSEGKAPKKTS